MTVQPFEIVLRPEVTPICWKSYRISHDYIPTVKKDLYGSVALGFLNRIENESEWDDMCFVHSNKNGMVRLFACFR